MNADLPRIVVTSGDPAGIGPDIILQAAADALPARVVAIGDRDMFAARAKMHAGMGGARLQLLDDAGFAAPHIGGQLPILHRPCAAPVTPGEPNPRNAKYTIGCVDAAVELCQRNRCDAMVTAPVHKAGLQAAGVIENGIGENGIGKNRVGENAIPFRGHTEWIAARCQTAAGNADAEITPVMMLVGGGMRVCLATTHLPLAEVPARITAPHLRAVLTTIARDLRDRFRIAQPRIGVCGLNPHAGEDGYLGREEIDIIAPLLEEMRAAGMDVVGPLPADTAFTRARLTDLHAVLAMYHDQGLPVIKHADFHSSVNVTLGLPILRVSVDHGTAFALAGTRQASAASLRAAIGLAAQLVARRGCADAN